MALAYRAVPLKDMEFVQYHPTGLPTTGTLLTEACRGEGGVLLNKHGRRFLQDYGMGPETPLGKPVLKTMELGPRDRVSQAFWQEQKKGNMIGTEWGDAMLLDSAISARRRSTSGCRWCATCRSATWEWIR
jgi:fumarate reductase flavoprotein subunit